MEKPLSTHSSQRAASTARSGKRRAWEGGLPSFGEAQPCWEPGAPEDLLHAWLLQRGRDPESQALDSPLQQLGEPTHQWGWD